VAVARVVLCIPAIENLDFDAAREGTPWRRQCITPNKKARVALFHDMLPFQLGDEVLVHLLSAQHTVGNAGGDNHVVADGERLGVAIDLDPASEVLAVEERHKAIVRAWPWRSEHQTKTECRA